ncbi:MAG: hypothetical protein IPJ71_06395 [Bdellovibrionales bacterium]|nr:hypothetical protein [Bdellovibrionales bacterium]
MTYRIPPPTVENQNTSVDGAAIAEARPNLQSDYGIQDKVEDECSKSQNLQNQKSEVAIKELMN